MEEWNKLPRWFKIVLYCLEFVILIVTVMYFAVWANYLQPGDRLHLRRRWRKIQEKIENKIGTRRQFAAQGLIFVSADSKVGL